MMLPRAFHPKIFDGPYMLLFVNESLTDGITQLLRCGWLTSLMMQHFIKLPFHFPSHVLPGINGLIQCWHLSSIYVPFKLLKIVFIDELPRQRTTFLIHPSLLVASFRVLNFLSLQLNSKIRKFTDQQIYRPRCAGRFFRKVYFQNLPIIPGQLMKHGKPSRIVVAQRCTFIASADTTT